MLTLSFFFFSLPLPLLLFPSRISWISSIVSLFILPLFFITNFPSYLFFSSTPYFFFDSLNMALALLTFWLASLMILASQPILLLKKSSEKFNITVVFLTFILSIAFFSSSFMLFYIFFEASLIPTLLLILIWGYQPERMQASMYLMMYTVTASLPLLMIILSLFKQNGHLSMISFSWSFPAPSSLAFTWWMLTLAAFLVKTPMYLTHLWLPKAHVEAPVAGSMVLAGVLLKLGSYGIMRVATKFILLNKFTANMLAAICLVGGVLAGLICIRQTDVKALIAYSSVSHMGLATAGIMSNTSWGWKGAFLMLIAHGLCSSCMFSLANMTYETIGSRSMFITKGLMNLFPSLTFWWFCFSACNMAAPPSINLASEVFLISSSMTFSLLSSIPLALMVFMAAAYSLFLYTSTQHGACPNFQNSLSLLTPRHYSICLAHFFPLVLFILKSDYVLFWI